MAELTGAWARAARWHGARFALGTMMKRTSLLLGLFSVTSLLVACASDPAKEANDAHNAELKSDRKAQQAAADDKSDRRQDSAEAQKDSTSANAQGGDASRKTVAADAKMKEAREVARAKATERLEKADARTSELRTIVTKAGGKATTASHDALTTVDTQRKAAKMSIDQLAQVPDDGFESAKSNTNSQLDTLEGYVKNAGKEVDKFK